MSSAAEEEVLEEGICYWAGTMWTGGALEMPLPGEEEMQLAAQNNRRRVKHVAIFCMFFYGRDAQKL